MGKPKKQLKVYRVSAWNTITKADENFYVFLSEWTPDFEQKLRSKSLIKIAYLPLNILNEEEALASIKMVSEPEPVIVNTPLEDP